MADFPVMQRSDLDIRMTLLKIETGLTCA
jgi:hypothetical protein